VNNRHGDRVVILFIVLLSLFPHLIPQLPFAMPEMTTMPQQQQQQPSQKSNHGHAVPVAQLTPHKVWFNVGENHQYATGAAADLGSTGMQYQVTVVQP
jgi:hypothetical protein